ncbi:MFS transporter [Methanoculleus sp. Wushi-C6]|uniref:MFS transporter n=1 Tax=Methanoculleus caldifontis TaxID=2651577 RepID=A0ABU3X411_9EURY|nr:MFS transporter [Methanoculleus sp. Wushi-C6]MDV2482794.1 MFS transporter [Methanoculleus sp. Wushi-C6]
MNLPPQPADVNEFDVEYAYRTMFILVGFNFMILYIEGMLTPSLPSIAAGFGISSAEVSLVLALYFVSGIALAPIVGKLGDIYGKKRILVYVLLVYSAAITMTGFSPTFPFMLVSRAVQGVGLAVMPLAMSIFREEFPREVIPRAQGIISGMFGIGTAISLPLGALVSNMFGWQTTYHTAIPFVLLLTYLVYSQVRESPYTRPGAKVDHIGAALLGGSLVLIVLAISLSPALAGSGVNPLWLLAAGLLLLPLLAVYEQYYQKNVGDPILNLRLLSMRNVARTHVTFAIASLGMFLAFQAYAYRLELPPPVGFGFDIFMAGLSLLPFAVAIAIFAPLTGRLVPRFGVKPVALAGAVVGASGFLLSSVSESSTSFIFAIFVTGSGIAMLNASTINLLVLTVDPQDMGIATSMNAVFRNLGRSIGAPIAGALIATFTVTVTSNGTLQTLPTAQAFQYTFSIAAALFILIAFVIFGAEEVLGPGAKDTGPSTQGR